MDDVSITEAVRLYHDRPSRSMRSRLLGSAEGRKRPVVSSPKPGTWRRGIGRWPSSMPKSRGFALALPDKSELARPTGVGRAIATYEIPIEGRDEWLAAARRLA